MKLQLLSDLHFEFHNDLGKSFVESLDASDVDVLILAGDITTFRNLKDTIHQFCDKYEDVIYVPGNHEHYNSSVKEVHDMLMEINLENYWYLHNSVAKIGDIKFFGGTMWFPYLKDNEYYYRYMSDFSDITNIRADCYVQNSEFKKLIKERLKYGPHDVVISHHLPSYKCVHPDFAGSHLNRFFVSEMDDTIEEIQPAYWFFGHTHYSLDFNIGKTRLVSNPYGYFGYEINHKFNDNLKFEI